MDGGDDIQRLWDGFAAGETTAGERLLSLHYDEFRRLARKVLDGDAAKLQIQPTDLAHEAAIRVLRLDRMDVNGRTHFLALSARVMRQTLMDEVRRHRAAKRSAPPVLTLWMNPGSAPPAALDLEALDEALVRLAQVDGELASLVEKRFFAGLTIEEIAAQSGLSESTVKRRWQMARAWLLNDLGVA